MKITQYILIIFFLSCQKESVYPARGLIVEAVYGLGVIQSESTYHAKAAIVSSVAEFFVAEGQDVKKNQKLFVTDQGSVYKAPFDGKVTNIPVTIRENLFPQTLILSLVDLNHLYLEVSLEQQAAMKLRKDMRAEISFEFFRNRKLQGKIQSIYPKNDQFVAKVFVHQWPSEILPGMSADVAFEVARKENALLVPTRSISNGHIVIRRDGKKEKLKVEIGLSDDEKTEILFPELSVKDEIILP